MKSWLLGIMDHFWILDRGGLVAYKWKLPPSSKIHPVFHISKLKQALPPCPVQPLPDDISEEWELLPQPFEVRDFRYNKAGDLEVLIKWQNQSGFENSWDSASKMVAVSPQFHLEDKVVAFGGKY